MSLLSMVSRAAVKEDERGQFRGGQVVLDNLRYYRFLRLVLRLRDPGTLHY